MVFQDCVRYALTARENVGFGDVRHVDDVQRVTAAAAVAGVAEELESLPQGYETFLGEPTAHLDALAEFDVFRSFLEATAGVTAVLISHRFSNVCLADRIVVLQSGRVVQEGTHAELVEADGLYARMFAAQAGGYR